MRIRKAVGSLIALVVLAASLSPAGASDAGLTAGFSSIAAAARQASARQKTLAVIAAAGRARPDSSVTPGGLCSPTDPNFKEYRYPERIAYCQRHVTQAMKRQVAEHYGIAQADWGNYEFDHLIPLAIGGDSSVDNLWPEPNADNEGENGKDRLELRLYYQMKAGTITQAEAVKQIYAWFDAYRLKHAK